MHYRYLIILLLILYNPGIVIAQKYTEMKTISRSLPVDREMTLEVDNKYGNIRITNWDLDSVYIKAEVEAYASDHKRLDKMFRGVDVNITGSNYMVRAQTIFTQNISILFESFKGLTSSIIPYESKLQINYYIYAPEYLDIRITNKYGDLYMEDNSGKVTLNLSNGALKANSIREINDAELLFCDASVNRLGKARMSLSFSEIKIDEAKDLNITSISSKLNIEHTETMRIESKRDKYYLGTAVSIRGNLYFTDFMIEELQKEINVSTKYGDLDADFISRDIEMITINSDFTDISLTFDPSVSYNLEIRHLNSFLVLPDKSDNIEKKTINEDHKEYMTYGIIGHKPGNVKVIIDATRGNIYLK